VVKGITAYEYQIGRLVIRIVHLRGAHWAWRPWRRVSIRLWPKEDAP
jgi:hypothetical protein